MGQNTLGIADCLDQSPSQEDLTAFMTRYCTADTEATTFTVVQVNGGVYDPSHPDIQYPVPRGHGVSDTAHFLQLKWSSGGHESSPGDTYLEWLNYVLSQPNIPQTISTPYGDDEEDFRWNMRRALCSTERLA